jgi:hypothetical protein
MKIDKRMSTEIDLIAANCARVAQLTGRYFYDTIENTYWPRKNYRKL